MKLIRRKVFETNSSSAHSLSINYDKKKIYDTLKVDSDGVVRINCGYYNFCRQNPRRTNNTEEKIAFFATLIHKYGFYDNTLETIKDLIKENTGVDKVKLVGVGNSPMEFSGDFDMPNKEQLYTLLFDKNSWLFLEGDEYSLDEDIDKEEFYNPKEILE